MRRIVSKKDFRKDALESPAILQQRTARNPASPPEIRHYLLSKLNLKNLRGYFEVTLGNGSVTIDAYAIYQSQFVESLKAQKFESIDQFFGFYKNRRSRGRWGVIYRWCGWG